MPVTDMDKIIPMFDAIQTHRHNYNSGDTDYSVTTLLDPPRVVHLNKRHAHKVDLYIQDLLHSFTGTAAHEYVEACLKPVKDKKGNPKYKMEERLRTVISNRKISGAYDILWLEKMSMWDMKNTSTWKIMFGDKHDWAAQQNMYRYMYWLIYKEDIKELNIIGQFRDWSLANLYRAGSKYPRQPVCRFKLPIWGYQKTLDFMELKIGNLKAYEDTKDDDLPECTWEDMWCKPDKVAVKTKRLKRALRVCDSMKAAKEWVAKYTARPDCKDRFSHLTYDVRPSERTRCESWCPVNSYCSQFNNYLTAIAKGGK